MTGDPDKALVRGNDVGDSFNASVGEPYFLNPGSDLAGLRYPPYQGLPGLLEELKLLHPGYEAVVANGCKQAILAALYWYRHRYGTVELHHAAPHWPSYPTMAHMSGLRFSPTNNKNLYPSMAAVVKVVSGPNNPDSNPCRPGESCEIWDASYAHPVYGWDGNAPEHEVSVWSAAKQFGVSGLRVGWLLTKNKELAEFASDYVEKTTSGVNVEAQAYVSTLLRMDRANPDQTQGRISESRAILLKNAEIFNGTITPFCLQVLGLPTCRVGMFAWFQPDMGAMRFHEALKAAKILAVSGSACGVDDSWFRMSLGHLSEVLEPQLRKLADILKEMKP